MSSLYLSLIAAMALFGLSACKQPDQKGKGKAGFAGGQQTPQAPQAPLTEQPPAPAPEPGKDANDDGGKSGKADEDDDDDDDDDDGGKSGKKDDDGELETDDDALTVKTTGPMTIDHTAADMASAMTVELLDSKGENVLKTGNHNWEDDGKGSKQLVLEGLCRRNRKTCARLTFAGKNTLRSDKADQCIQVTQVSKTQVKIIVDLDGTFLGIGTCIDEGKDDTFVITCPETTELKVKDC